MTQFIIVALSLSALTLCAVWPVSQVRPLPPLPPKAK